MKLLTRPLKFLFALVVLAVIALFVAGYFADDLAKAGIEKGGTDALGVKTSVETCHVGIITTSFGMTKLAVANPEGFGGGNFLELGGGKTELNAFSLFSDKVHVPSVELTGTRLMIVQDVGTSNYGQILDNLGKYQGPSEDTGEGKRFVIDRVTIKDTVVVVKPSPKLGLAAINVPVDTIELENVGSDSDKGVLLGDLAGIIVESILKKASVSADLPGMIKATLHGKLPHLSGLADAGIKSFEGFTKGKLPGGITMPGVKKGVEDKAKDAVKKGLQGLGIR